MTGLINGSPYIPLQFRFIIGNSRSESQKIVPKHKIPFIGLEVIQDRIFDFPIPPVIHSILV